MAKQPSNFRFTRKCPHCNNYTEKDKRFCQKCGQHETRFKTKKNKWF